MEIDIEALKQSAEAASPGPWQTDHTTSGTEFWFPGGYLLVGPAVIGTDQGKPSEQDFADAAFLAAANPAVILELIARLTRAESRGQPASVSEANATAKRLRNVASQKTRKLGLPIEELLVQAADEIDRLERAEARRNVPLLELLGDFSADDLEAFKQEWDSRVRSMLSAQ